MYSFYGGRPGNSFIIITSFKSKQEMIDAFKLGPNYTDVHFDEHVLINTVNKNDPDNGKIFRRGYNYTDEETGGAVQIGQIVGPSGPAPDLSLKDYDEIENQKNTDEENPEIIAEKIKYSSGTFNELNSSLVPGYDKDTQKFNDDIKWNSYSIRTENNETCEAYIGFKFPYLVIDWQAESVSAYEAPSIEESSDDSEESSHPFYKKWKLKIPQAKRGTSLSNLRINTESTPHQIVYDQTSYENQEDGETTLKTLGPYNMISSIEKENGNIKVTTNNGTQNFQIKQIQSIKLNENYELSVKYFNDNQEIFPLRCIKEIDFNEENGTLTFSYANSDPQIEEYSINWIKNAEIKTDNNDNEFLYLNWVNPIDDSNENSKSMQIPNFKWIKKLNLTNNGILEVTYNNGEVQQVNDENNPIKWVTRIGVSNKKLRCFTNDGSGYDISVDGALKWIDSISLTNNGQLEVEYNYGDPEIVGTIRQISELSMNNETGEITATYNDSDDAVSLGTVRQIESISMNDETGEITASYNDSEEEILGAVRQVKSISIDENTNHLMITYSDSQGSPDDVGSVAANLSFIGNQALNLNWSGLGRISVQTEEIQEQERTIKYLDFTMSTTSLIGEREISAITPENVEDDNLNLTAFLRTSNQQISFGSPVDRDLFFIGRTLVGLNFTVEIPTEENQSIYENLSDGDFVDIFISGLDLAFTEEGDNG